MVFTEIDPQLLNVLSRICTALESIDHRLSTLSVSDPTISVTAATAVMNTVKVKSDEAPADTSKLKEIVRRSREQSDQSEVVKPKSIATKVPIIDVREYVTPLKDYFYDQFVEKYVNPLLETSRALGEKHALVGGVIEDLFVNMQRDFLLRAANCKRPSDEIIQSYFATIGKNSQLLSKLAHDEFLDGNYAKSVNETLQCFGWLMMEENPSDWVKACFDASQVFLLKIRNHGKDWADDREVIWSSQFFSMMKELIILIPIHFPTGVKWNEDGVDVSIYLIPSLPSITKKTASPRKVESPRGPTEDDVEILRDELLRIVMNRRCHVDQMEEKIDTVNTREKTSIVLQAPKATSRSNRVSSQSLSVHKSVGPIMTSRSVSVSSSVSRPVTVKATTAAVTAAALVIPIPSTGQCVKEGCRWSLSGVSGNLTLTPALREFVYIKKSFDAVITIKGKCKAVYMDHCTRVVVNYDDCISTVEINHCEESELLCYGFVPAITVDDSINCIIGVNEKCNETVMKVMNQKEKIQLKMISDEEKGDWMIIDIDENLWKMDEMVTMDVKVGNLLKNK